MDSTAQQPTLLSTLVREMRLRGYSYRTIKAYTSYLRSFIRYHAPRHPRALSDADIRTYIDHLISIEGFEASTIHQVLNALRFLYVELYKRPMVLGNFPRPKKARKLPVVLSLEEVGKILGCVKNLKHRTLLMIVYSAGLRVGEVVRLRVEDLDADRGLVHIRSGKGKKDRYTLLSAGMMERVSTFASILQGSGFLRERYRGIHIRSEAHRGFLSWQSRARESESLCQFIHCGTHSPRICLSRGQTSGLFSSC